MMTDLHLQEALKERVRMYWRQVQHLVRIHHYGDLMGGLSQTIQGEIWCVIMGPLPSPSPLSPPPSTEGVSMHRPLIGYNIRKKCDERKIISILLTSSNGPGKKAYHELTIRPIPRYQISQNQFSQLYFLQGARTEFLIELSRTAEAGVVCENFF